MILPPNLREKIMKKATVVQAHKEMWIAICQEEPKWKNDEPAFHESWSNYTDSLCKGGEITERQYNTWSTPPMPKRYPKA